MNKFEEKSKNWFSRTTQYKQDCISQEAKLNEEILDITTKINTLETSKSIVPLIADELDKTIKTYNEELMKKTKFLRSVQDSISEYSKNLRLFADNFCPHEKTTHSHTDYHKNEDFSTCDLCGKTL